MDSERFDTLTRLVGTGASRRVFGLGLGLLGLRAAVPLVVPLDDVEAGGKKGKGKGKKKKKKNKTTPPPTVPLAPSPPPVVVTKGLGQTCTPSTDTCSAGLQCNTPTTRQNCNSTVEDIDTWCCIPPGGSCSPGACTCCGDNYCGGGGTCIDNPEG